MKTEWHQKMKTSLVQEWLATTSQRLHLWPIYRKIRSFDLQPYRPRLSCHWLFNDSYERWDWFAVPYGRRSLLVFLERDMTEQNYNHNDLEPVAIPYHHQLENQLSFLIFHLLKNLWYMIGNRLRQLQGLEDFHHLQLQHTEISFKLLRTQLLKKTLIILFETCLEQLRNVLNE